MGCTRMRAVRLSSSTPSGRGYFRYYTRIEIYMDKIWLKSYPPGVPAEIDVGEFQSLKEIAEKSFRKFADGDAYVQMGRAMTYAELDETSRQLAAWLQKKAGLKKG